MRKSRSERKFKKQLKEDPGICILQTKSGNYKLPLAQYPNLLDIAAFVRISDRVVKVKEEYAIDVSETSFHVYPRKKPRVSVSIMTFAQILEQSLPMTDAERSDAVNQKYGMSWAFALAV